MPRLELRQMKPPSKQIEVEDYKGPPSYDEKPIMIMVHELLKESDVLIPYIKEVLQQPIQLQLSQGSDWCL